MLKCLFDQVLTKNCVFLIETFPPIAGNMDITETFRVLLKVAPDLIAYISPSKHESCKVIKFSFSLSGTVLFQTLKKDMIGVSDKIILKYMEVCMPDMKTLYDRCKKEKWNRKFTAKSLAF